MKNRASCVMPRASRRVVRAVFAAVLVACVGVVSGSLTVQATSLTDAYVQDGLVVFWDAIENQGPGQPHSNTPTAWLDATGHGYGLGPYLTLAQPVWTDDGCVFPDSAYTTKTALGCSTGALLLPAGTAPHTLEFIADAPVVGSKQAGIITLTQTPLTSSAPAGDINFRTAGDQIYCRFTSQQFSTDFRKASQVNPENGSFAVAMSRDEAGDVWWHYQGRKFKKVASGCTQTYGAISNVLIGAMSGSAAFEAGFTGTVHAVRLYSRALSDKEMELNAMLDRQRYHGGETVARIADDELQWKSEVSVLAGTGTLSLDGCEATSSVEQWLAAEGEPVTLTAIPAKGFAFVAWSGDVDGLTDEQLESATVQLPRGLPRKIWATFSEDVDASYHASDYVQDGLVIQFDALENAGARRYLPDPDVWRDLTGNGQDATARTGNNRPTWTGNAACTTNAFGKQAGFTFVPCAATLDAANGKTPFTMQYCATSPTVGNGTYIFGFSGGSTFGFRYTGADGTAYYQVRGTQTSIAKYAETLAGQTDTVYLKGTTLYRYVDKTYKSSFAANIGTGTLTGGGYLLSPSVNSVVNLHAVRFYNRVLTPFEIAHNARLDRVRFKGDADETRVYTVTPEGDVARGTSTPAYTSNTATESAKGAVIAFSLTGLSTDGFDGQRNVLLETGVRDRFLGWRANGGATNVAESVDYALDDDTDFRWVFEREYFQDYSSAEGGTIAHDGVGCAEYAAWCPTGQVVRLTAVPDDEHVFFAWTGTLDGLSGQEKNPTIDVLVDRSRAIRAVFRPKTHTPRTATWTGGSTVSATDWDDAANWDGEVPGEGDDVVFGSVKTARTIILSHETPVFNSIVIDSKNTLMTSNWFTKIQARTVTVKSGGVITCGEAFKSTQMSNRVWIVCDDFDLQSGGSINVDKKGYEIRNGPGKGYHDQAFSAGSAGHGGSGGASGWYGNGTYRYRRELGHTYGLAYDSLEEPEQPGSGSCGRSGFPGIQGGGAVRIDVVNHVKINGTITAQGGIAYAGAYPGASGGSVWISCATVEGSGTINVQGGNPLYSGDTCAGGGGGGRIALTWSDSAGQKAYSPALAFNCGGSIGHVPCSNSGFGEAGTLYLTDASFFPGTVCKGGGRVTYATPPTALSLDSLTVNTATLDFEQQFPIAITGDLTVNKPGDFIIRGRTVTVGGNVLVRGASSAVDGGATLELADKACLVVGGNFTAENYGYIRTDSGETNETSVAYGVMIDVAGNFTLSDTAAWYPCSHPTSLAVGPTVLKAKSVTVAENAKINGMGTGWQCPYYSSAAICGHGYGTYVFAGTGSNVTGQPGCSHAGKGGSNSTTATYDNFKAPSFPGSAGGYSTSNSNLRGGSGGGQVWIEAVKDITVDGAISMNGRTTHAAWGGGSGGSVYLRARKVIGSGAISAAGGASSTRSAANWTNNNGGGGGGYITFRTDRDCPVEETFTGTCSVDGGLGKTSGAYNEETGRYATDYRGWPGIVTSLCNPAGLMIFLR